MYARSSMKITRFQAKKLLEHRHEQGDVAPEPQHRTMFVVLFLKPR